MTASRWTAPNWQKRSRPPARPAVPRLYGLQGRYFLPVLPLLLLTCLPRRLAAVPGEDTAQSHLTLALALVQAGVVVNIMLAVIAR